MHSCIKMRLVTDATKCGKAIASVRKVGASEGSFSHATGDSFFFGKLRIPSANFQVLTMEVWKRLGIAGTLKVRTSDRRPVLQSSLAWTLVL